MPLYEYLCGRCGRPFERAAPMSESGRPRRCPKCRGMGKRVPSLPRCRTETTLSHQVRDSYATAGHKVDSWGDVKRLERDGTCVLVNRHDLDTAERNRKTEFRRRMRVAREKVCDERITISSKKGKRRAVQVG